MDQHVSNKKGNVAAWDVDLPLTIRLRMKSVLAIIEDKQYEWLGEWSLEASSLGDDYITGKSMVLAFWETLYSN